MRIFAFVAVAVLALNLAGCSSGDVAAAEAEIAKYHQAVDANQEATSTQLAEAKTALAAAQAAGDTKAAAAASESIAQLEKSQKILAEVERRLDQAQQIVNSAKNEDGSADIGKGIAGIANFVPPPWNLLVVLGGGIVGTVVSEIRRRRTVADAKSIIKGIDALRSAEPEVAKIMSVQKGVLLDHYTDGAFKMVESAKVS